MKRKRVFSILQAAGIAVLLLFALPVDAKMEKPDTTTNSVIAKDPIIVVLEEPAEAIDLGLPSGTLWASYNIGATKPEEYGHYFAWGETEPKDYYGWTDYKYADVTEEPNGTVDRSLVHDIGDDISGTSYDVAHTRWGNGWRMPNEKQANELVALCSWEESQLNGTKGYRVTGPNGKSIFLPSSGEYGDGIYWKGLSYWTSTISSNMIDYATFIWECDKSNIQVASHARCVGKSIRPVAKYSTPSLKVEPTEIDFGVVESGTSKTKTFTVTNTGKSDLTFYADACIEFTYRFDVSDNQTEVALAPGASKTYTVTAYGMGAGYKATTNILIKTNGDAGELKVHLNAIGDDDQPLIDKTSLKMAIGEKASVKIKTSSFSAVPDDYSIVDYIGSGPGDSGGPIACQGYDSSTSYQQMGLTFTALKAGVVHIIFTDLNTNKTATLTITVTDGNSGESGWHLVTDSGEQFPMSQVGMLVAVDESAYFSVLDTNGNVLAEDVLRVHFTNSDPVSVENITTEKSQNMLKRYVDNQLTLVGVKGTVNVYSVEGVRVATTYAAGQETIINVSSLPSGIYIVKCGNQSFKFNKK